MKALLHFAEADKTQLRNLISSYLFVWFSCLYHFISSDNTIPVITQVQPYVHVFKQCTQNWYAVASIIENVLQEVRRSNPNIKEAFIRSDNAGCYHSAQLILSIPCISKRVGIKV